MAALSCILLLAPNVNAQVNQVVNAGDATAPAVFPSADCIYKWTNDNPSIGLAASGTGNIASFIAKNDGFVPAIATVKARLQTFGYQTVGTTTYAIDLVDYTQAGVVPVVNASLQGTSPDGSAVYFMSGTDNHTLYKVDGRNNKLLATIPVSAGFYNIIASSNIVGLIFSPDGNKIYTYSTQTKSIVVINTITNTVENTISLNPGRTYNPIIQMSPDGGLLYLLSGDSSNQSVLTIVNTVTNSVASTVTLTVKGGRLFLNADGTKLYIGSGDANSPALTLYDTITGAVSVIPTPAGMGFSSMSLDGKKAYLTQNAIVDMVTLFIF
ncbi:hypothetical protein HK413_00535 [Mucilaginibacter sp. S1162]|uniref:YncE family protein n=1 Tax=Mucilaginibacter humi TaxID=2732510 RepID=A0ABX1VYK8_9SPHI|nr:hypothetical protein [Mucilaginibacter humi]NNU33057.1 hypothetical protein [Mucilaginibacter humi]